MWNKLFGNSSTQETGAASTLSMEKLTAAPVGIKKLNDSVYELQGSGSPDVEVIFFHGLQPFDYKEAYWKTWLSRDGKLVWPREWLGWHLPNARILSISYDSGAVRWSASGREDPYNITEKLIHDIVLNKEHSAGQKCPVVLVGHSLGGIIIKQFIKGLHEKKDVYATRDPGGKARMETFLDHCQGVFYYSTPQGGSDLATKLKILPNANTPIADLLTVLGRETTRLNNDFMQIRRLYGITTAAIFETLETRKLFFSALVVTEAANRIDLDRMPFSTHTDHLDVCKPINNENDNIVSILVQFIEDMVNTQSNASTSTNVRLTRGYRDNVT